MAGGGEGIARDVTRYAAHSLLYLISAILMSVFLIMSVTAVEKPEKTTEEYADDEDGRRRGAALGRRKVRLRAWKQRGSAGMGGVRGCGVRGRRAAAAAAAAVHFVAAALLTHGHMRAWLGVRR